MPCAAPLPVPHVASSKGQIPPPASTMEYSAGVFSRYGGTAQAMCGIAGWVDWEKDLSQHGPVVEAMTAPLAERGPDAGGTWLSAHCAFGHRRLAVVDLVGGVQPMVRRRGDRTYVLVYNGQLYNTDELRAELTARGHAFTTQSDTEVLLVAYIEWGPACTERLNGIYAFAVWDEAEQRLFLARDRFGVKPLFYKEMGRSLVFGSELKALLAHPLVRPEVDAEGLAEILYLGPSRTPGHGVFRGVRELLPGYWLTYDRRGLRTQPYWRLESRPHTDGPAETAERVRELLRAAVHRQLVADVPVATLLSGGVDSSAITAFAAEVFRAEGRGPLHTWSIDYAGNDRHFRAHAFQPDPDRPFVQTMVDTLGTVHHDVIIDTPELVAALTKATLIRDLPGMADVDASLYLFCREIKKGATVVLSGECADEVFGGYPWFHQPALHAGGSFPWVRSLAERTALLQPGVTGNITADEYVAQRYSDTVASVPRLPGEEPEEARRREMFYLNLCWFMATLLDRNDRMSMAAGVEARVPFCDHHLVEYVWNIPWSLKTYGGREKGILREALRGVVPEAVRIRRKSPFPKTHNPDYFRMVRDLLLSLLDDPACRLHEIVRADRVRALAEQEQEATGLPWFGQLMAGPQYLAYLIQLEVWLRHYKVVLV